MYGEIGGPAISLEDSTRGWLQIYGLLVSVSANDGGYKVAHYWFGPGGGRRSLSYQFMPLQRGVGTASASLVLAFQHPKRLATGHGEAVPGVGKPIRVKKKRDEGGPTRPRPRQPGSRPLFLLPHGPSEIERMYSDSVASRCVSGCTVGVVTGIYLAESFVYHWHLRPGLVAAAAFNVLWSLALWSYWQTCLTDPGTPRSAEWREWSQLRQGSKSREQWLKEAEQAAEEVRKGWSLGPSWCPSCRVERPQRAHHCTSCGCCVLRMDHHCPWVGSCRALEFAAVETLC